MLKGLSSLHLAADTVRSLSRESALSLAASIAFYSALSLAPLLLLVAGVAGILWDQAAVQEGVVREIDALVGAEAARLVHGIMNRAIRPRMGSTAALAGIALALFGATTVVVQLQYALNRLWGVRVRAGYGLRRLLWTRVNSLGLILAIGLLLLVSLLTSSALNFSVGRVSPGAGTVVWKAVDFGVSLVLYTVVFATIFKVLPDVKIAWRDVTMGATLTALLFAVGKASIGLYLRWTGFSSLYGAAGSLFVLLIWVYYVSILVLAGAAFTQAFAHERGREIAPKEYAETIPGPAIRSARTPTHRR